MRKLRWLLLLCLVFLTACQTSKTPVTILADGQAYSIRTTSHIPAEILAAVHLTLGPDDRLLYQDSRIPLDASLPEAGSYTLTIRRAVPMTLVSPDGQKIIQTSAQTVGQALEESGYTLQADDRFDPPVETRIEAALIVHYLPSKTLTVTIDGRQVQIHSAAANVGQALAEAGIPLIGLDASVPAENEDLPANGKIRIMRVTETVGLTQKSIPFSARTEPSADLELDQQALIQGGEPGLAITRVRSRSRDGVKIQQTTEDEYVVRPPQDRIMGYGTKIVIRSATVDGETFQYYRVLNLMATSYSPCRSATPDGSCSYGTSSGLPVQRGTVAMVYSWYLAFGFDRLYIPGYGYATVGDLGGGPPGNHYWIDLGFTDAEYQPMSGTFTVYFLAPVPANLVTVLP